jgi:guanyl-specific ribonuclease Sa
MGKGAWTGLLLLVAVGAWSWSQQQNTDAGDPAASAATDIVRPAREAGRMPARVDAGLPAETRDTLARIRSGGPFAHRQDGSVFGNREGLLPEQPRGYYHEYTVETPGAGDRGARRIVAGGDPPREFFYTDDHYRSFHRLDVVASP